MYHATRRQAYPDKSVGTRATIEVARVLALTNRMKLDAIFAPPTERFPFWTGVYAYVAKRAREPLDPPKSFVVLSLQFKVSVSEIGTAYDIAYGKSDRIANP